MRLIHIDLHPAVSGKYYIYAGLWMVAPSGGNGDTLELVLSNFIKMVQLCYSECYWA